MTQPVNTNETKTDLYRRQFLGKTAAAAGFALAPGMLLTEIAHAKPADEAVSTKNRWGL